MSGSTQSHKPTQVSFILRSIAQGLPSRLWSRTVVSGALALSCAICGSPALGQLRTGRGERAFYKTPPVKQSGYGTPEGRESDRESSTTASILASANDENSYANDEGSRVVSASGQQYLDESNYYSESAEPYSVSSHAGCQGCDSCDGMGMSTSPIMMGSSCGAGGCGDIGCGGCSGGALLAPAASAYCPPGCGPLMALWYRMRVRAEVPMYWRRDQGPPALVTTSATGTAADVAGELEQATTDILFGNGTLSNDATAGIRLTFNTWLDAQKCYGLTLRYWNTGDQNLSSTFGSSDFDILARPFFNTTTTGSEEQDTQLVAFPNESIGSIQIDTESAVGGLDFYLRRELYSDRFNRLEWLWGYQHASVEESLSVFSNTTVTGNVPALTGTNIAVSDRFETENDFHGMSYGLMNTRTFGCLRMETMFRLGAGNLRRKVSIAGSTTTSSGGASVTSDQGLLARATNAQPYVDDTFIVLPELGINLGYRIRPGFDFTLGYNYMVIPKVAQAAQQIDNDLAVNLSDPLNGALDPQLDFDERQFWIHSLGFGLQLRY
ncbi:MAG: BBP7 family outer membrane beta-barrel protein [Pirellulaceae bacterium]